ncbi:MAG: hypothetical protein ACRDFW_08950 [bacterium]
MQESEPESAPDKARILELLEYSGPSSRQSQAVEDGVALIDYRDTDENERNISKLLSSQGIPFHIERPTGLVRRKEVRMAVTVPRDRLQQAEQLLSSAAEASVLEIVEGTQDLLSR